MPVARRLTYPTPPPSTDGCTTDEEGVKFV